MNENKPKIQPFQNAFSPLIPLPPITSYTPTNTQPKITNSLHSSLVQPISHTKEQNIFDTNSLSPPLPYYYGPSLQNPIEFQTLQQIESVLIPNIDSETKIVDDGNASPRFMRATTQYFPESRFTQDEINIPLSLIIQPIASLPANEQPIPLINLPDGCTIPRCGECQAYINPFTTFSGIEEFSPEMICNFCENSTNLPFQYNFTAKEESQKELFYGTVDYIPPSDYQIKSIKPPIHFFIIEVSENSFRSGFLECSILAVKKSLSLLLESVDGDENLLWIGFITFDSTVHVYDMQPNEKNEPTIYVINDVDEPFSPIPTNISTYKNCKYVLDGILNNLLIYFGFQNQSDEKLLGSSSYPSATTSAIVSAEILMKSRGGFIYLFQSSLSSRGIGKLKHRDNPSLYNTDEERTLLIPQDSFYQKFSKTLISSKICVYIFSATNSFIDLSTIGILANETGGDIFHYFPFRCKNKNDKSFDNNNNNDINNNKSEDKGFYSYQKDQFLSDISHVMKRYRVFDVTMRIRFSRGIYATEYFGKFPSNSQNLEFQLPGLHCEKTFGVELSINSYLQPIPKKSNPFIYFQTGLLYTTLKGERRLRVHTLGLPFTNDIPTIYRFTNLEALISYFLKKTYVISLTQPLGMVRDYLLTTCIDILSSYRIQCKREMSIDELACPENLELLPLYLLSIIKHTILKFGCCVPADERITALWRASSCPLSLTIPFIHPRCFRVDNLDTDSQQLIDSNGKVKLPPQTQLCKQSLTNSTALLFENGYTIILWISSSISRSFLEQVLGVTSFDEKENFSVCPEDKQKPNSLNGKFYAIYHEICRQRQRKEFSIDIVKQKNLQQEYRALDLLVLDQVHQTKSYPAFFDHLKKAILERGEEDI